MDKIQTAIAKARAERGGTDQANPAPSRLRPGQTAVSPPVAETWGKLRPMEVSAKQMERNRIVAASGGHDTAAFDMLRTRVLQQMRANNWRRLAITSPTASCGKSTIALNLSMSFSRLPDFRTVLLELDMRRPSLAKMLGVTQDVNFADVLKGETPLEDNALRFSDNLVISTNAKASRNPAELLSRREIPEMLSDIETRFAPNITVFDMPPMLVTDDMMAFAQHVDCVLLIAAAEATTIKEIDICERDLASQTNVMGVILNKCRFMGSEYNYSYY